MELPEKLPPLFILLLVFFTILRLSLSAMAAVGITTLVFKGCANQTFEDPTGIYSQNLKSLVASLVSQSSQKTFFTTAFGDGDTSFSGLYQCRGDLTYQQCYNCVSKIPEMANKLCGEAVAARVQLSGCYLRYEISGFTQVSGDELIYKVCGSIKATGSGFEERRNTALDIMVDKVKNELFYTASYESVYVLGQCEGNLGSDDCGDCVKGAVDKAESNCGDSISGQIYLQRCYISYSYYPNGVPSISSSSPAGHGGSGQKTQRIVAISVGGLAAFGFVFVCLMFAKSVLKKKEGKHSGWG